jgi:hypothetical protein
VLIASFLALQGFYLVEDPGRQGYAKLAQIARSRGAFEEASKELLNSPDYWESLYSMPGSDYAVAYYPERNSSVRFVYSHRDTDKVYLAMQRFNGKRARTEWGVKLEPGGNVGPRSGTLLRILAQEGFQLPSNKKLKPDQMAELSKIVEYASYSQTAISETLWCGFFDHDGTAWPIDVYYQSPRDIWPMKFPITAKESELLGYGSKRWHGPGKFHISVH